MAQFGRRQSISKSLFQKETLASQRPSGGATPYGYVSCLINTPGSSLFYDPVQSAAEEDIWVLGQQRDKQFIARSRKQLGEGSSSSTRPAHEKLQLDSSDQEEEEEEEEEGEGEEEEGEGHGESIATSILSPQEPHQLEVPLTSENLLRSHHICKQLRRRSLEGLPTFVAQNHCRQQHLFQGLGDICTEAAAQYWNMHKRTPINMPFNQGSAQRES